MRASRFLAAAAFAAAMAAGALPVRAESMAEPADVRLARILKEAGLGDVTYSGHSEEGGVVRLEGVRGGGRLAGLEIGSVAASGIEETKDAARAAAISFGAVVVRPPSGKGDTARIGEIVVEAPEILRRPGMRPRLKHDRILVRGFAGERDGKPPVSLELIEVTASDWLPGGEAAMTSRVRVKGSVPAASLGRLNPSGQQVFPEGTDLAYEALAKVHVGDDGEATVGIAAATNIFGRIEFEARLQGVRKELFTRVAAIPDSVMADMAKSPAVAGAIPPEVASRLLTESRTVRLASATLQIDEMQWVRRWLEGAAARRGQKPDAVAAGLAGTVKSGMAGAASPELAARTEREIAAFLANPDALTISLKPEQSIGILEGLGGLDPSVRILDHLGFTARAE